MKFRAPLLIPVSRYEALSALLPTAHAAWKEAECEAKMKKEVLSFQQSVENVLKRVTTWW